MTLTRIFYEIDEFCQELNQCMKNKKMLGSTSNKVIRNKKSRMHLSEVLTIIILFHLSNFRNFKNYYLNYICVYLKEAFPNLVSYSRFVELMKGSFIPLLLYLKNRRCGKLTGISFIDSTSLKVCNNKRILSHKVFNGVALRGQTSMGWFYGFKLHLVVNDRGELLSFVLTPGNTDDRNREVVKKLTKKISGKLFGDRGYISQKLFEELLQEGVQLVTRLRKNMKNKLMPIEDKILLRKRAIIESINDQLKNICQIEHTRHRSTHGFLVNLFSGLIAYTYFPKKPSLKLTPNEINSMRLLAC